MNRRLELYQQQLALIENKRRELDIDYAQVLAEAFRAGYSVADLLYTKRKEFDL